MTVFDSKNDSGVACRRLVSQQAMHGQYMALFVLISKTREGCSLYATAPGFEVRTAEGAWPALRTSGSRHGATFPRIRPCGPVAVVLPL